MSRRILVVPEDPTLDAYVLKPVIEAACAHIGKPNARVEVMRDPKVAGVDQALSEETARKIARRHRMADLVLYCVDRDGRETRDDEVRAAVYRLGEMVRGGQCVGGRTAHQEVEVWCLSPHSKRLAAPWDEVRTEGDPKERFFDPLVAELGFTKAAGKGREPLGRQAAAQYWRVRDLCPELKEIEEILRAALA